MLLRIFRHVFRHSETLIFRAYDWCYLRYYRLNRESARAGDLILFHLVRHSGDAITLSDGTYVRRGDPIVVIHVKLRTPEKQDEKQTFTGMTLIADLRKSLRVLALEISGNSEYQEVRAIRGDTVFGPVTRHCGFDTHPVVNMETIVHRLGLANARTLIASARKARTGKTSTVDLKKRMLWTSWISRKTLMTKYRTKTA